MELQRKITKISVFAQTILSVTNALMRMDGSTKRSNQIRQHMKTVSRKERKKGVSYKLTVFHLSWIGVKCLVDSVSFEERP